MYSTIVVIYLLYFRGTYLATDSTISDENVWCLLHIDAALPQMHHEHVLAQ